MNPNAKEFVFRPSAPVWTPKTLPPNPVKTSDFSPPPPPPDPPIVNSISELIQGGEDCVDNEEDIDENDPLWKATLKLTLGNRKEAIKLLEDPDSLMQYPEIKKIMDEGAEKVDTEDTWEDIDTVIATPPPDKDILVTRSSPVKVFSAVASNTKISASSAADVDEGEPTVDQTEISEGDPREHLSIVFIGHVDAGKSTLSGSILYLMGQVDARTIERYEREAKQRNRESWFLAFILDTSEEERAKGKTVEVGRAHFETASQRYTILDAPGHKNYVPNMIAGATQVLISVDDVYFDTKKLKFGCFLLCLH